LLFELTAKLFDLLGIETELNGNPNWLGLLIVIRLLIYQKETNFYTIV